MSVATLRARARVPASRGNPSTFAFPYTPPDGMNAYGAGSPLFLTRPSATPHSGGQYRDVTTGAQLVTALGAYQEGDIIRVMSGSTITAPTASGFVFATRTDVTQYVVMSEAAIAGTLGRGGSVNPEGEFDGNGVWVEQPAATRAGWRIRPSDCTGSTVPIVQNLNTTTSWAPVFQTNDASGWTSGKTQPKVWIEGLEIRLNPATPDTANGQIGLVVVGGTASGPNVTAATMCPEFVVNACWIHGKPSQDLRRGFVMQGRRCALINSWVSDIHVRGNGDNQCVWQSSSDGPSKVVNCTLMGSGENQLFGGADPAVRDGSLVPRNALTKWCHVYNPKEANPNDPSYLSGPYNGIVYPQKNLLESKDCFQWWIEGCVLQNCRISGQTGYPLLFQALSDNNSSPQTTVSDIAIRYLLVEDTKNAFTFATPVYISRGIQGLSNTTPIVMTATNHGFQTGDRVKIGDKPADSSGPADPIVGNRAAIGNWNITVIDANSFSLDGSSGNGVYDHGGRWGLFVREPTQRIELLQTVFARCGANPSVVGNSDPTKAFSLFEGRDIDLRRVSVDQGPSSMSANLNSLVTLDGPTGAYVRPTWDKVIGFRGSYGVFGGGYGEGNPAMNHYTVSPVTTLALQGSTSGTSVYSSGLPLSTTVFRSNRTDYYADPDNNDYTTVSSFTGYGADWAAVKARTEGVVVAP